VRAPLPQVSLMPTGGVSKDNAADFIRAGAEVLCVGSALIDKQAIAEGNYEKLTENARELIAAVERGREEEN
ncbi:MAG: 2-dehydro-3-deoxyphosphogluconate aldolase, partial [Candidatus Acetothermia bacterium]